MDKFLEEDLEYISSRIPKKFYNSCFFITGATGLIGSLIVKSIIHCNLTNNSNIKVVALVRNENKVKEIFKDFVLDEKIKFYYGDIIDRIDLCDSVDYVIHAASQTSSKEMVTHPVETIDTSILGTRNVLNLAREKNVKSFVYLSSMEAFGICNCEDSRVSEKDLGYIDLQNIRSCYSESKRICELLCNCYCSEYGINVKTARLAQVFGAGLLPSENRVFAQFARSALSGQDIILHTDGTSWGNYCYTSDAICGIFTILEKGQAGDVYTVVNESSSLQIKDMANLVIDALGSDEVHVVFDIPKQNNYGYAPKTVMKLSSKKLESLGWKPHVSLRESYTRMQLSL